MGGGSRVQGKLSGDPLFPGAPLSRIRGHQRGAVPIRNSSVVMVWAESIAMVEQPWCLIPTPKRTGQLQSGARGETDSCRGRSSAHERSVARQADDKPERELSVFVFAQCWYPITWA